MESCVLAQCYCWALLQSWALVKCCCWSGLSWLCVLLGSAARLGIGEVLLLVRPTLIQCPACGCCKSGLP